GDEGRVADRLLPRAEEARRVVEEKARRPALVELELAVAVAAQGRASSGSIVLHQAPVIDIKLRTEGQTLINHAGERLISVRQVDAAEVARSARRVVLEPDAGRIGEARADLYVIVVVEVEVAVEP